MTALAAAAGAGVVQAAGTDAWETVRNRLINLFGQGNGHREIEMSDRLDRTVSALQNADEAEVQGQESMWRDRITALLESLPEPEREQALTELRALLEHVDAHEVSASVIVGPGGVAAGRDVSVRADQNSIAAAVINGGVNLPGPPRPDR
ncbi:hypothetical protein AB4039_05835 [Streptomyces sp. M-16]|uniref:hypothetical protein n=1 Tax=Streptomyces sp. M-16 TaxID=3233040 RepID=UPI003F950C51